MSYPLPTMAELKAHREEQIRNARRRGYRAGLRSLFTWAIPPKKRT
jgi:hypothetical protein